MREISFVKRLEYNFNGSVTKKALVIGDADNDQRNELVCANLQGDLAIFKDRNPNRYAYASELGMVTACLIGDVINADRNYVAAINTEGWLFIYDLMGSVNKNSSKDSAIDTENDKRFGFQGCDRSPSTELTGIKLDTFYNQRMPANCKELLLADLDGDGQNELIVGLTDRVLRTYKWIKIGSDRGKFVGLYKWEFADQIGAVSLNPSRHDNCQDIIVAQPGGTYAKLECFDKKPIVNSSESGSSNEQKASVDDSSQDIVDSPDGDNVRTEYISKLTPEYHQLALAQMRNHHVSTEVLGGIRDGKNSSLNSLIVIATLDGTLMLVNKNAILWSLQVDHQLFALASLEILDGSRPMMSQSESTCTIVPNVELNGVRCFGRNRQASSNGSQYFVACAWNGKTYIIDEERNYLRFKFNEAVSAFTAGIYHFDGIGHASLVYASFNNQIILYYDVILDQIRPMYLLDEVLNNMENSDLLAKLEVLSKSVGVSNPTNDDSDRASDCNRTTRIRDLLHDLLYTVADEELSLNRF